MEFQSGEVFVAAHMLPTYEGRIAKSCGLTWQATGVQGRYVLVCLGDFGVFGCWHPKFVNREESKATGISATFVSWISPQMSFGIWEQAFVVYVN